MHSDILSVAIGRAKADPNISGVVGTKVYNHVPDNTAPPYIRVQWGDVSDAGDKDSQFVEGSLTFDYWTEADGDKTVLDMINYITDEFHQVPLVLTQGSTNCVLTRETYNTFLEGDGLSHHGIITFSLYIED